MVGISLNDLKYHHFLLLFLIASIQSFIILDELAKDEELDEEQYELEELKKLAKQEEAELENKKWLGGFKKLKDEVREGTVARGVYPLL